MDSNISVRYPCALIEHYAMKAYWVSGGIASRILDHGIRWRWVISFTPLLLYPHGKSPWYPLVRRLGGPQNRRGRGGEENSQPLPGLEPPFINSVAQRCTTELSRLQHLYKIHRRTLLGINAYTYGGKAWDSCSDFKGQHSYSVNFSQDGGKAHKYEHMFLRWTLIKPSPQGRNL
jgi:hypothetical protein